MNTRPHTSVLFPGGTRVTLGPASVDTTFPDGQVTANWVTGAEIRECAELTGHGEDPLWYCYEHEICHVLVPLALFGERGYVSWMSAIGRKMNLAAAKAEERLIYYVQRLADPRQWTRVRSHLGRDDRAVRSGYLGELHLDEQLLVPAEFLAEARLKGPGEYRVAGRDLAVS